MPEIDLRDFPYMPLYVGRLQRSKAWLACKRDPALAFYMMNLWMRAWQEIPCGSIEDDDDVLADAAMCDDKTWAKIKGRVLRGWERRDDGRWYHSVVTEIAEESWTRKQGQRQRTEAARQSRLQRRQSSVTENVTESVTSSVTEDVTDNVTEAPQRRDRDVTSSKGIEGKGREEKGSTDSSLRSESARARGARLPADWEPSLEDARYAKEHAVNPMLAAEEFRNYWLARPGKDGTKLDWSRTFRNRVLELQERGRFPLAPQQSGYGRALVGGL